MAWWSHTGSAIYQLGPAVQPMVLVVYIPAVQPMVLVVYIDPDS